MATTTTSPVPAESGPTIIYSDGTDVLAEDGTNLGVVVEAAASEGITNSVVDLADAGGALLAAVCCEPTAGAVLLRDGGQFAQFGQGSRVDGVDSSVAIGDLAGFVKLKSLSGEFELVAEGLPLVDVALGVDDQTVFVLINEGFSDALGALVGEKTTDVTNGILRLSRTSAGWEIGTAVTLDEPACRIDFDMESREFIVLRADLSVGPPDACVGGEVLVLGETGETVSEHLLPFASYSSISFAEGRGILVSSSSRDTPAIILQSDPEAPPMELGLVGLAVWVSGIN
ncbi:MAG: hypothetical protein GY701_29290 [Sulfitobacter sp.]|nr:hypothetical protein [Sulfitobacter sp.]